MPVDGGRSAGRICVSPWTVNIVEGFQTVCSCSCERKEADSFSQRRQIYDSYAKNNRGRLGVKTSCACRKNAKAWKNDGRRRAFFQVAPLGGARLGEKEREDGRDAPSSLLSTAKITHRRAKCKGSCCESLKSSFVFKKCVGEHREKHFLAPHKKMPPGVLGVYKKH